MSIVQIGVGLSPEETVFRRNIATKRAEVYNFFQISLDNENPFTILEDGGILINQNFSHKMDDLTNRLTKPAMWERNRDDINNQPVRCFGRKRKRNSWIPTDPNSSGARAFKRSRNTMSNIYKKAKGSIPPGRFFESLDAKRREVEIAEYRLYQWTDNALQNIQEDNNDM